MKESHVEGLASHNGPELCGGGGDTAAEALAGERASMVLSPEIRANVSSANRLVMQDWQHASKRYGKSVSGSAGSETHSAHVNHLRRNREALQPALEDCTRVPTANSKEARL